MIIWSDWIGMCGPISVSGLLLMLGLLSRKLGTVTKAKPYYLGFYVAAVVIMLSVLVRFVRLTGLVQLPEADWWGLLYNGLFALGVTLGVVFAWRYWSWLLAERN